MQSVNICLDSGMRASDACYLDARGTNRVVTVMCYGEDVPRQTCSKHMPVHYCVTGGGVAGEYCDMFPDADVQTRSLVKLTRAEIDEIRQAGYSGLVDAYLNDGYVYYVGNGGDGLAWDGFRGNANSPYPYLVCPLHSEEYWGGFDDDFGFDDDWDERFDDDEGGDPDDDGDSWG